MITKLLEIVIGLGLIFAVPYLVLRYLAKYQEKKEYHKDYDVRYAYYMKEKLNNSKV